MSYSLSFWEKCTSFGFVFNDSFPQYVFKNEPLFLPDDTPNLNSPTPVLNNLLSTGTGFKIIKTASYQISYSLSVNLNNSSESLEKLVFSLLLNNSSISESLTTVCITNASINELYVVSDTIIVNLTEGDLIQITPIEINEPIEVTTAALTIIEIEHN
ncbi:hypothetical protein [Bacillus cereus]|uniref:hypothetical protein n=1 Tax=Bacillus cereus TaxID=1396 RepID=UPI0018F5BB60|nr:hypothetical protein [Bacillus cereus]MBJ8025533.1 hypothetical protein [Bacillus cereus]MBJ8037939.1 hypothetical protein [Bacillus cereus]